MAITIQKVCDRARISLNDDDKIRWSDDPDLLQLCIGGLQTLRKKRSDMFRGHLTDAIEDYALATNLPISADYTEALAQYVIARALMGEDEAAVRGAAPLFYGLFEKGS